MGKDKKIIKSLFPESDIAIGCKKLWDIRVLNDEFYKTWGFHLCSCAASFRSNGLNLWQLVLTKKTYPHTYRSVGASSMGLI